MMMMKSSSSSAISKRKRKDATDDRAAVRLDDHDPAGGGAASSSVWTEEMHSSFLNRMEAAFVHHILFGSSWTAAPGHHAAANNHRELIMSTPTLPTTPRLDRYVPDFAESTHDGHRGDAPSGPVSCSGMMIERSRAGRKVRRNGCCTAADISTLSCGVKAGSTTATRGHPLPGPPKESGDDEDDADQVVPLFQMPETSGNGAGSHGNKRRSTDLK